MSNKVKVVGYAQKVVYTNGIEYTNFTPDLVGFQLASNGGTPLFTMGSFSITTNIDPKLDKFHNVSQFSNFITLADLNVSINEAATLLSDNAGVYLNLDKRKLDYYALFGSLSEYIRVALEDIIINWPASLFVTPNAQTPDGQTINNFTVENYTYDDINEISRFKLDTNFIINKFGLVYTKSGSLSNTFNVSNTLRNLTLNYLSYSILYNNTEYPLIGFTGSTTELNDYVYFEVKGNPFSGLTGQYFSYHIKPNKTKEELFFNSLPDFQAYLLNRQVTPIYTATFNYPVKSENGVIIYINTSLTWPVSDGYNIDFDSVEYIDYASSLIDLASSNDSNSSNLINRFLVSESISSFDTVPVHLDPLHQDTSGGKVNKTLQVYGVNFDELNRYIIGIKFSNVVSYNKQDNTPDIYLKNIARVMGWELISSVLENDLLANYVTTAQSTYSGQSVGLTPVEADVELWRRIILNSPWLWKSKGSRKSIEFLLKFIGAPQGLFQLNEYIYKANAPLDIDLFTEVLTLNGLDTDISIYPIDEDGYPRPLPDTPDMYFQNNGLWYRETGGTGATVDILAGNNPHVGPYDGGFKYINQFRELIPNFSAVTISSVTTNTTTTNLYTNYDLGTFDEGVSTATTVNTVEIISENGIDFSDCVVFTPTIELDPNPSPVLNDCGCETQTTDNVLSLCIQTNSGQNIPRPSGCNNLANAPVNNFFETGMYTFNFYQYNQDGSLYVDSNSNPVLNSTTFANPECCSIANGIPFLIDEYNGRDIVNSGYVCCNRTGKFCGCIISCKWLLSSQLVSLPELSETYSGPQAQYLQFIKEDGTLAVVTPDGCNCLQPYSIRVPNILDPYTGQIGYGCQITQEGLNEISNGYLNELSNFYFGRNTGSIPCFN
jgi:hypothetical protein